jgi:hypothetical protein
MLDVQSNTTGYWNVAVGFTAFSANTSGAADTAIGGGALNANIEGTYNTAVGSPSMTNNTTGSAAAHLVPIHLYKTRSEPLISYWRWFHAVEYNRKFQYWCRIFIPVL